MFIWDYEIFCSELSSENASAHAGFETSIAGKAGLEQISNNNLLDNPWFTVNQRGQTTYTNDKTSGTILCVDRWKISGPNMTLTVNDDKTITITNNDSIQHWFGQVFYTSEYELEADVEYITQSIRLSDDKVFHATHTVPGPSTYYDTIINSDGLYSIRIQALTHGEYQCVFYIKSNSSITIKAAKVEHGIISTLAQDDAPNYAMELLKCQRYFVRLSTESTDYLSIGIGYAITTSDLRVELSLPVQMRIWNPTLTYSDLTNFLYTETTGANGTSPTNIVTAGGSFGLGYAFKFVGSFTQGKTYEIYSHGGYIDLSADI